MQLIQQDTDSTTKVKPSCNKCFLMELTVAELKKEIQKEFDGFNECYNGDNLKTITEKLLVIIQKILKIPNTETIM